MFHTSKIPMFLNTCSSTCVRFRRVIRKNKFSSYKLFLAAVNLFQNFLWYRRILWYRRKETSKIKNQRLIETRIDRLHPFQFNLNLKRTEDNRRNRRQNRDCEISLALIKGFSLRRDISPAKGWSGFSVPPFHHPLSPTLGSENWTNDVKACWLALFRVSLSSTTAQWRWSELSVIWVGRWYARGGWPTLWSRTRALFPPSLRFLSGCCCYTHPPRCSPQLSAFEPRNSLENLSGMLPICRKNKSSALRGRKRSFADPLGRYIPWQSDSDRV